MEATLDFAGIPYDKVILEDKELIPDKKTIGTVVAAYKEDVDFEAAKQIKFDPVPFEMKMREVYGATAESMEELLSSLDAPIRPQQVGIYKELFSGGICYAKEIRDRYTLLGILGDLGLSEKYAEKMAILYNGE